MDMHRNNGIRTVVFILLGIFIFFITQWVLKEKWCYPNSGENVYETINGIDRLDKDSLEVLFLGTSHMAQGMSPMKIYEDTGVVSYNMATSRQRIEQSYFLLKRVYERQTPSVVVLDAGSLFYEEDEEEEEMSWRFILDSVSLDKNKVEMSIEYGYKQGLEEGMSAIFPILKYHSRWSELDKEDFQMTAGNFYYSAGEYVMSQVAGTSMTKEQMNEAVPSLQTSGEITFLEGEALITEKIDEWLYDTEISKENIEWLCKIQELCEKHDTEIILIKIPSIFRVTDYGNAWTNDKSDMVKEISKEYGIEFIDLLYDSDLELDLLQDTSDGGQHLNIRGAEKVAAYFEHYLEEYKLEKGRNDVYDEALEKYQRVCEVAYLQSEIGFDEYIKCLRDYENELTILVSASDEFVSDLEDYDYDILGELGLRVIKEAEFRDSYLAVIKNGEVKYEAVSDRTIEYEDALNGKILKMSSSGGNCGGVASIKIDGDEIALNRRGLNIVVLDNEANQVIDSVTFDTYDVGKPAYRDNKAMAKLLRGYEKIIISQ